MGKKFISWNVNGIRACMGKGFLDAFNSLEADIFCLQETKMQEGQLVLELDGYHQYWCYAEKKGYSGTAIFTKEEPLSVSYGIGVPELDTEGRMITLEFEDYYFITEYVPNAQDGLKRIDHRMKWEDAFREYVNELKQKKGVVLCGDLNVAHNEIDLKNPKTNVGNPGFSNEERGKFSELLDSGFIDTFRYFYPDLENAYSWWSYRFHARDKNVGWRIDYFVVSENMRDRLESAAIHPEIFGSDHCPVELCIK
ncbi:MAG: exodeoxyribonuclease III [Clostridia bacterium]|nr:exodeoxyribonuclease III [Clostridia bacterium]